MRHPPYVFYGIELADQEHLGHHGRLSLSFFNDRLAAAIFYPTDVDRYLAAVERHESFALTDGRDAFPATHTRVWLYTDARGRRYIARKDTCLQEEETFWVMRYP